MGLEKLRGCTGVKDQGQCGSCWAFSTTGAIEGAYEIATGALNSVSEEQLVDCIPTSYTCYGCGGGWPDKAMDWVHDNGGIASESAYPYTAGGGVSGTCHSSTSVSHISNYTWVNYGDESSLQTQSYIGPVSVCIDASSWTFQMYTSGVYNQPGCSTTNLDHAVLVVGYDTTSSGQAYWIVKNSWGTGWGQAGYIWMSRNKNNQCGIASHAVRPNV